MSPLRKLARDAARSKSYKQSKTTSMFYYYFEKEWREKGHPKNLRSDSLPSPTKKGHKACYA